MAPVRGFRGKHAAGGSGSDDVPTHIGTSTCGLTYKVTSASDKYTRCPEACPFYAQNRADTLHCTFQCVTGDECHLWNPNKPIPDKKLGVCRAPMVQACLEYNLDPNAAIRDSCLQCQSGYGLGEDGQCYYKLMPLIYLLAALLLVVCVVLVVWLVDMACRATTNPLGLKEGLDQREATKLQTTANSENHHGWASEHSPRHLRQNWPLLTNLCRRDVAGPGIMLHFNFQAVVIVWALLVAAGWAALATFVDEDLWVLGTRRFGTPRENCILVAWGYETQQRLMWTKILFCVCVYFGSFVLALLHSIRQLRLFQSADHENTTMKDYVLMLVDLPTCNGAQKVETELSQCIREQTGKTVVGISIAWDYEEKEDTVMSIMNDETDRLARGFDRNRSSQDERAGSGDDAGDMRQKLYELELKALGPGEEEDTLQEGEVKELVNGLSNSKFGFAVFNTQLDRDEAFEKVKESGGIHYNGVQVQLKEIDNEPTTIQWVNFGSGTAYHQTIRLLQGFGFIVLGLLTWVVVFYAPYAWSIYNFNYDNGQQPGFAYGLSFSMVVVIGNAMMYEICNRVSEYVGFKFKDDKEACYMVLYLIACSLNIALDMLTTYFTAWEIMTALNFRTYHGQRLEHVPMFPEGFETYAIQRNLAENLYAYAFPSTYLIPFLIEPIPTIVLPRLLGHIIVRTHKELRGRHAEDWLACAPMELGRYADLLLNMLLGIGIFYFPGGYTATLFVWMAISHIYIYVFDHYRVLRVIPTCSFASMSTDWWCQVMLAPLCGTILACLIFKANNQPGYYSLDATHCVLVCFAAFVLHTVVHVLLIIHFVPMLGKKEPSDQESDRRVPYSELSKDVAASYFSTNPIHCLRSKLIYKHSPPCIYWASGKEHLLEVNREIGCHFDAKKACAGKV
eukprot:TRINITY_DN6024_c0_g1_i1.p1 TRINITY_DN6024_c0_g1~~TRINITY_DN6024_c0_g1_i1.p1  ORF type:complete len:992 (+),score=123.91 TRINITY_DN6024_c0_g1_i1:266-2977(+)